MPSKVKALIISGYGLNCERELAEGFSKAGAMAHIVHLNELIEKPHRLQEMQLLALPGGFSFGDHLGGGRSFANKMMRYLEEELASFIKAGKGVIGICNGFQSLAAAGLVPNLTTPVGEFTPEVSLVSNAVGRFENRWVTLKVNEKNPSFWLRGFAEGSAPLQLPVRHGEGRVLIPQKKVLREIVAKQAAAFWYTDETGAPTTSYPANPNGSDPALAGITNRTGTVLGIMPHPEAFLHWEQLPNFKHTPSTNRSPRLKKSEGTGLLFFKNAVDYAKAHLL